MYIYIYIDINYRYITARISKSVVFFRPKVIPLVQALSRQKAAAK